jgi:DNA repair photolyase
MEGTRVRYTERVEARSELRWPLVDDDADPQGTFFGRDVERHVGKGEFRGMEFLHVRARRIINEVPNSSRMPFRFTINPYRGCSHACTYCLAGDTPILMADGRTKSLADVRTGDSVYGTVRQGRYRRYVTSPVLAHWSTMKPAFRITLGDGTRLVASADHRFLTERGWKHVTGTEQGRDRRPHLTLNDKLIGTGGFVDLRVVAVEPLEVTLPMFDIQTATGDFIANGVVSHNCFARPTHEYLGLNSGDDFDRRIVVKVNAVERLRAELAPARWGGHHIAMGTNTDPYQRCEGKYRLTRGIAEVLGEAANPFSILTKSTLILRDLDVLAEAASHTPVRANFSIGTLDEDVWRATEPGTPHPMRRVEAVARLNEAGIPCGVLVAPVLPGLSDDDHQLEAVVRACVEAGARSITPLLLHLRPGVREHWMEWLAEARPHQVAAYEHLYPRSYAPRRTQEELGRKVAELVARFGGITADPGQARALRPEPPKVAPTSSEERQLSLDVP